jgi:hypothetical protein
MLNCMCETGAGQVSGVMIASMLAGCTQTVALSPDILQSDTGRDASTTDAVRPAQ